MRVRELRTSRHRLRLRERFATSRGGADELESVRLAIRADGDGTFAAGDGWATATPRLTGETPDLIEAVLRGPVRDALVGVPLADADALFARLAGCVRGNGAAKAAADLALHELLAAHRHCSVANLVGAVAPWAETDVTVSVGTPEDVTTAVRARVALGFRVVKLKVGAGATAYEEIRRVRAAFAAADDAGLRLDANGGWARERAAAVLDALQSAGVRIEFVEQPVDAVDLDGMRWLRERTPYPLMADESVQSVEDVRRVADAGAADLVNIKLAKVGGIHAARDAVAAAARSGLECVVGSMMEAPPSVAAAVLVAAGLPRTRAHDLDAGWWVEPGSCRTQSLRYAPPVVCYAESCPSRRVGRTARVGVER